MDKTKVTKDLENKTLVIERTFDAPKAKVWRAYSDKDWFTKWWGPEGWETTVKTFDFKPGGQNHYCMKCVDKNQGEWFGQESWGLMEYGSMSEPDAFTYKDFFSDADGNKTEGMPALTIEMEFVEQDGKTTMISRSVANTAEEIEKLVAMGMIEGFSSSADKLEKLLATAE
jgi:uncharacterized protein YndB with AHSA1/START domain